MKHVSCESYKKRVSQRFAYSVFCQYIFSLRSIKHSMTHLSLFRHSRIQPVYSHLLYCIDNKIPSIYTVDHRYSIDLYCINYKTVRSILNRNVIIEIVYRDIKIRSIYTVLINTV